MIEGTHLPSDTPIKRRFPPIIIRIVGRRFFLLNRFVCLVSDSEMPGACICCCTAAKREDGTLEEWDTAFWILVDIVDPSSTRDKL